METKTHIQFYSSIVLYIFMKLLLCLHSLVSYSSMHFHFLSVIVCHVLKGDLLQRDLLQSASEKSFPINPLLFGVGLALIIEGLENCTSLSVGQHSSASHPMQKIVLAALLGLHYTHYLNMFQLLKHLFGLLNIDPSNKNYCLTKKLQML